MKKNYVIAAGGITTIGELRELLADLPANYLVCCCGVDSFYINVNPNKETVVIDTENFNDYYGVNEW